MTVFSLEPFFQNYVVLVSSFFDDIYKESNDDNVHKESKDDDDVGTVRVSLPLRTRVRRMWGRSS